MATSNSGSSSFNGRNNYFVLGAAIVDICASVLRCILRREIPTSQIQAEVKACKNLQLRKVQIQMLNTVISDGYGQLDFSLLYLLIRTLCINIKPTNGWSYTTPPGIHDTTEGDDINRFHFIRNEIFAHPKNTSLPDAQFNQHFQILKDALSRMDKRLKAQVSYSKQLETLKTSVCDEQKYAKKIEDLGDKYEKLVEDIGQQIEKTLGQKSEESPQSVQVFNITGENAVIQITDTASIVKSNKNTYAETGELSDTSSNEENDTVTHNNLLGYASSRNQTSDPFISEDSIVPVHNDGTNNGSEHDELDPDAEVVYFSFSDENIETENDPEETNDAKIRKSDKSECVKSHHTSVVQMVCATVSSNSDLAQMARSENERGKVYEANVNVFNKGSDDVKETTLEYLKSTGH